MVCTTGQLGLLSSDHFAGVDEIKSHPFFRGVDWATLLEKPMDNVFLPKPDDELDTSYFIGNISSRPFDILSYTMQTAAYSLRQTP